MVLRRENTGCVIPRHKSLAIGTLKSAIKQAGITDQDFLDSYKKKK
ncbi:MAG: type II toxin-antitoxin system HicA family toxin [Thermodesulfobacteriota bacterium]|nr:type II toxin-antitoxin system HicA family toxin [Thermodesulfobacteriota bacterium]